MMVFNNFKWVIALIVFIITLALLFGGQMWRQKQFIEKPLVYLLENMDGIEKIYPEEEGRELEINITVGKIDDFSRFYYHLEAMIQENYNGNYTIKVIDSPDNILTRAYQKIHLALYEGAVRGNYVTMGENIENIKENYGIEKSRLTVTDNYIFLQLHSGDYFLYRRILRQMPGRD